MNIIDITENISVKQCSVKQLPADFQPADTSPQLSGPYPGRNATRGYLVGEASDQDLDEELQTLPFGSVNVVTPAETRQKHKEFMKELIADGVPERTAYDVLDSVRTHIAKGVDWDTAVSYAFHEFNIDDPHRGDREKEYHADQDRVRQQTVKTLQNFYKQIKQQRGQEKAQAIALMRRYWPQATPEQRAQLEQEFGHEPEWQQLLSKVEQRPRRSEVDEQDGKEPVNVQGLTLDQWKRRVTGAGGKVLGQLAKMPNAPVVAMIRGKKYHWQDRELLGRSAQSAQGRLQQQATQRASGKMTEANNLLDDEPGRNATRGYLVGEDQRTDLGSVFEPNIERTPEYQRGYQSAATAENPYQEGTTQWTRWLKGRTDKIGPRSKLRPEFGGLPQGSLDKPVSEIYNPVDQERQEQRAMDREREQFKRDELEFELRGEEERMRAANEGTFYLRIDGRIWRRNGEPVSFQGRERAVRAGQTIKDRDPQREVVVTRKPTDQ